MPAAGRSTCSSAAASPRRSPAERSAPATGCPPSASSPGDRPQPRTVRKAVQSLVHSGQLVQRRGSGTFVAPRVERLEQALSLLTSFSEDMARRGKAARSIWLGRGIHAPTPEEVMALGLTATDRVARLERVRLADEVPLALESASLPSVDPARPGGGRDLALRGARAAQPAPRAGRAAHLGGQYRAARGGPARGRRPAPRCCGSSASPTCLRAGWSSSPVRSTGATPMISRRS